MATSGCIACAVDESSGSKRAATVAARLARDLHSPALLIHVIPAGRFPYGLWPGRRRLWRKRLSAIAGEHCFPEATGLRLRTGVPTEELLAAIEDEDAELVVVASREQASAGEPALASVTSALIQKSSCPVVIVPRGAMAPLDSASVHSVVCGVAGSDTDIAVVRLAHDLARRLGARLHAVHAYEEGALEAAAPGPRRRLKDALDRSRVQAHETVLPLPVTEALERVADENQAGLIVIGSPASERPSSLLHRSAEARRLASGGNTALVLVPPGVELAPGSGHYELPGGSPL